MKRTLDPAHPLFGLGYAKPAEQHNFVHINDDAREMQSGLVAEETPVALVYNGRPHVVMMCTPADIEDFALGFTLSEEIVASARDVGDISPVRYSQGIEVAISIPAAAAKALETRGRELVGRTGCGLCGVTTIDEALRPGRLVAPGDGFTADAIFTAIAELPAHQHINADANAVHAAAWATPQGRIVLAREDVGRHNALDKLIGAVQREGLVTSEGFAVITSRASYELVQKCAAVGIVLLAAISRPTGLAIRMAEAAGLTLVALARGRSANVYAHAERILPHGAHSGPSSISSLVSARPPMPQPPSTV